MTGAGQRSAGPPRAGLVLAGLLLLSGGCASTDTPADPATLSRRLHSPAWRDDRFQNDEAVWLHVPGVLRHLLDTAPGEAPDGPVAVVPSDGHQFSTPPPSGLRVTWFGHSSTLLEIDGVKVLTDPLWSDARLSPVAWAGPRRWYPPPVALEALPTIDVVVISHDHYDHLDRGTIEAMKHWKNVFMVPLGVGDALAQWGIPRERIIELDWWQSARIGDVRIVSTPARHRSGRLWRQADQTLWSGFAIIGPRHRAYYSGDTGLLPALRQVGARYGPFDVTLIEAGQYDADWPDWHLGPEQAVEAHHLVGGKVMIPVHWGLVALAHHAWTEPVERVLAAARCTETLVMTPRPGESVEPSRQDLRPTPRWWPPLAWRTATDGPVVSTENGDPARRIRRGSRADAAGC